MSCVIFQLPNLSGFESLKRLEISYNEVWYDLVISNFLSRGIFFQGTSVHDYIHPQIKSMAGISDLGSARLLELYLAANKISKMEGLDSVECLRILELGSNRIRTIENISHLLNLQELWLGRNRICEIQNLNALKNMRQLSLQSNRLSNMTGIEECVGLEELYLSHNNICTMEVWYSCF